MKYDLKKDIDTGVLVALQWHGAATLVLIDGDSVKTPVNTGDVLKVKLEQAKRLLRYSGNWTLEGDVPLEQVQPVEKPKGKKGLVDEKTVVYTREMVEAMKTKAELKKVLKALGATADGTVEEMKAAVFAAMDAIAADAEDVYTPEDVAKMETKEEVLAALEEMGVKANAEASLDELKSVLLEELAA